MEHSSSPSDRAFCKNALPGVSRTFALTIRLLPARLEYPVLVSYLLCRIADTIEDSGHLPLAAQLQLLEAFRASLTDPEDDVAVLRAAFDHGDGSDGRLVRRADVVLREFHRFPDDVRAAIRPWVEEMCTGMAQFLATGDGGPVRRLASIGELERYCYFVAGTVGHLLTDLFRWHAREITAPQYERLHELATEFGLGLQLTNIIKDVADDLKRGVSYIPTELLGPDPAAKFGQEHQGAPALSRALAPLVERTWLHLRHALDYCTCLPRRQYGIRLFCLTSLFFAAKTLRLARGDIGRLGGEDKLKISRGAVYRTLATTCAIAPVNTLVRAYYASIARVDPATLSV